MPIDRTMTVALTDPADRAVVTFRRTGSQVFVDTFVDGAPFSTPVSAADLAQLATFLGDLANTRWADVQPSGDAPLPAPSAPATVSSPAGGLSVGQQAPRPGGLPPYPQTARWVPAPSGNVASDPTSQT